jgi:hypothetical protein
MYHDYKVDMVMEGNLPHEILPYDLHSSMNNESQPAEDAEEK